MHVKNAIKEYVGKKVTYPEIKAYLKLIKILHYRRPKDADHHLPGLLLPLTELDIGIVTQMPLDYTHLVCLGVVRRLVSL